MTQRILEWYTINMNIWIFIVIIVVLVVLLLSRRSRETAVGICATALDQTVRKSGNKEKILALLGETNSTSSRQEGLSNSDIREALKISDRSVIRYMDELEKEGKVKQVGSTGRSVAYRLK